MIYYRHAPSIIPGFESGRGHFIAVEYPIIIFNSFNKVFQVDMMVHDKPKGVDDNFQLEVNYVYLDKDKTSINEYFLIDIVDFTRVDSFLKILEEDKKAIEAIL